MPTSPETSTHKLDSVAHKAGAVGAYNKAVHPSPKQPNQPKPTGTTKDRKSKLIIGEPYESSTGHPKEQIIKLDPNVSSRGEGKKGVTIGKPPSKRKRIYRKSITHGMGGRRRGKY